MRTILVTGASGFLGGEAAKRLSRRHNVIAISRKQSRKGSASYMGNFAVLDDLRQLDQFRIDTVLHLAAEMGGTSEEAGLETNVQGTRRLIRHFVDRGCRRFILASSIAAAGCLSPDFVPDVLPIPSDHRCKAKDAYGLSKYLAEEVASYFGRLYPEMEFCSLRLGAVLGVGSGPPTPVSRHHPPAMPFLQLGFVRLVDVLDCIDLIANAPLQPGSRVYHLVGPDLRLGDNVKNTLSALLGDRASHLVLTPYDRTGAECPPIYGTTELLRDFGYLPKISVAERADPDEWHR